MYLATTIPTTQCAGYDTRHLFDGRIVQKKVVGLATNTIRNATIHNCVVPRRREGLSAKVQRQPHKGVPPSERKTAKITQKPLHEARMVTREPVEVEVKAVAH